MSMLEISSSSVHVEPPKNWKVFCPHCKDKFPFAGPTKTLWTVLNMRCHVCKKHGRDAVEVKTC